jgi:CO/xanthine dehydrogenase FAD-binding subunit
MSGIRSEGGRTVIGAGTTLADLSDAVEPLGTCARRVADIEIREQATIGGNLCAPPGVESPRGDLQAALLVLDAQVRSAGAGGERTDPVEDVLASGGGRLVLDISVAEPEAAATAMVRRPHAHAYTVMRVCAARVGGEVRIAVSGAAPHAVRLRGCEAAAAGGAGGGWDPASVAERALEDVTPSDDALASGWYRAKVLPVLVRDALTQLG